MEIKIHQKGKYKVVELVGRIDGLSSSDVEKEFTRLSSEGERTIVANFQQVSYISSAGLRIFLSTQKMLKKIGGELILVLLHPSVQEVFNISGFASIFKIYNSEDDFNETSVATEENSAEINGIKITYQKVSSEKGSLSTFGSNESLYNSLFTEKDVVSVPASQIQFGTGLAAIGNNYDEYKNLFGETVVIANNFFNYPALKKSAVDFMLKEEIYPLLNYKFLYGFGITGNYSSKIKFDEQENYTSLSDIIKAAKEFTSSNITGIALIAESAGIYGMHLKRSPIAENKVDQEKIFEQKNFADWIDFTLEPANGNNIVAAAGVIVKERSCLSNKFKSLVSEESDFHIHCAIFEKGLLNKNLNSFDKELSRIFRELQVYKVQHLIGKSKFKSGMFALIELNEEEA